MTEFIRPPADTTTGKRVHASLHNDGQNDIYTQVVHLADRLTPDQKQAVDNTGSAFVRFAGGAPDFDVFGRQTVSEPNLMGMYKFYETDHALEFQSTQTGGGTVARDGAKYALRLQTGTASGDVAAYDSHRHYHYRPGNAMTLLFTCQLGDTGKAGLVRRMGWISATEGLYFEQTETGFYCVLKDQPNGTETRVERAAWSNDRLDGAGGDNNLSGATYDPTKIGIWWIDFQYLGAGAVRFGTFVNGEKVVCHVEGNYNSRDRVYMSDPSMSVGFEQENTGITASSSEMYVSCAVVTNDGYDEYDVSPFPVSATATITSTSWQPIVSMRASQLFNGLTNRSRILPQIISALTESQSVELAAFINPTLTGDTWAGSILGCDFDTAATSVASDGLFRASQFIATGFSEAVDLSTIFLLYKDGVTRHYNGTGYDHITVAARLLSAGSSLVGVSVNTLQIK